MSDVLVHTVAETEARDRLDRVLARAHTELSRSRLKSLTESGHVTVGGLVMTDPAHRVNPGTEIRVTLPPPDDPEPQGEDIPLNVIAEDDALIVIDKQAGLVVHPGAGNWTGTLVNALIRHCGDSLSGIGGVRRPGIVHRLDKDTTGLMVIAKTDTAHRVLADQFADHGRSGPLRRSYLAFVWGRPSRPRFTIDLPLDRDPRNREKISVRASGREAITHVELIESFPSNEAPFVSLVRCTLETGRTHQIRVHLAHQGFPLLGDKTYATGFRTKEARLPPLAQAALAHLDRQALHAYLLGFSHPTTGETVLYESALPDDLAQLHNALKSWQ